MERYQIIKEIGRGSYGVVWKAFNNETGEVVAIKKLFGVYRSEAECINLNEIKSLSKMNHPNIVKLKQVIGENNTLYLVFEYMEGSLYGIMSQRTKPFCECEIKNMCCQVFQGLAHMHQKGYIHRDLKPENLLVSKGVIKIADLGQAREINGKPPYTDYVTTRWYRSPEVLLHARVYGPEVDMWAMGAIMAELFASRPLFQGFNEADMMYKICSVIGSPTKRTWSLGLGLADCMNYRFPEFPGMDLRSLLPSASPVAIDLIAILLSWNPSMRPTAVEALQHPFFYGCCHHVPRLPSAKAQPSQLTISQDLRLVFKTTMQQEFLKQTTSSLRSCTIGSGRSSPTTEDLIRMLPENPFDF